MSSREAYFILRESADFAVLNRPATREAGLAEPLAPNPSAGLAPSPISLRCLVSPFVLLLCNKSSTPAGHCQVPPVLYLVDNNPRLNE